MSEHVLERLSAYLDGELPRDEQATVQAHLGACADCAQRLEELAALDATARVLPVAAPAGYFEALPARLRARLEPQRRVPRLPIWGLAAAAALALAVLTPAVLRRAPAPAAPPVPEQKLPAAAPAERSADSLQLYDEGLEKRPAPHKAAKPAASVPARPAPRPAAPKPQPGFAEPRQELRRREEAAPRATAAPFATPPPAASAPETPAAGTLEVDQARRRDAETDQPREGARDLQASRKQAVAEGEGPRTTAGTAAAELRANRLAADARYEWLLAATPPDDAAVARARRDAWRAFARDHPSHAGADEARVRALEAGAAAYRLGLDPSDLEQLRADAAAYLARPDAVQPERVRALLLGLEQ